MWPKLYPTSYLPSQHHHSLFMFQLVQFAASPYQQIDAAGLAAKGTGNATTRTGPGAPETWQPYTCPELSAFKNDWCIALT